RRARPAGQCAVLAGQWPCRVCGLADQMVTPTRRSRRDGLAGMNQNEGERMSIMKREFTSARFGLAALIGVVWASAALAHVSLEVGEASVRSAHTGCLR